MHQIHIPPANALSTMPDMIAMEDQTEFEIAFLTEDHTLELLPGLSAAVVEYDFEYDEEAEEEAEDGGDHEPEDDDEDDDAEPIGLSLDDEDEEPLSADEESSETLSPFGASGFLKLTFNLTPQVAFDIGAVLARGNPTVLVHHMSAQGNRLVSSIFTAEGVMRDTFGGSRVLRDRSHGKHMRVSLILRVPHAEVMFPTGLIALPPVVRNKEGH